MDKPVGPTSHDVVALVRKAFNTRRVGHAGTLDPFATGVLLVLVGQATRLAPYLVGLAKTYTGVLRLGLATTTDDLTGETVSADEGWQEIGDSDVARAMDAFIGTYAQRPPVYSALKIGGEAAHRLVRRGEVVAMAPRQVEVFAFRMAGRQGPDVRFEVAVGSGTYVRALARDVGERLGCGAHLRELRRTSVGPFVVDECVSLETVRAGGAVLRPPGDAVRHLPTHMVDDAGWAHLRHGRPIPGDHVEGAIAVFSAGHLVAMAEGEGTELRPRVVFDL